MASPFSIFRKHQRTLMALLTLAAMFTFVCVGFLGFGVPELLQVLGVGQRRVSDPVVVRTKWRTLTASDLHGPGGLIYRRILANRFVEEVQREAVQFPTFPGFGAPSEEDVVMAEVLRHKAEEMGLSVNDAAINRFLLAITAERLTRVQIDKVREALNVTQDLVYEVLHDEVLAYNAGVLLGLRDEGSMFASEAPTLTPEELRASYHKLRDRAEIEAVAVPVEAFLDQTGEPSQDELRRYFERYREFFSHPRSPMPGFRQHRRIEAEYVRADFDKTVDAMTATDEEVEAYYEKNKDSEYRLLGDLEPDLEGDDAEAASAKSDENASPEDPAADAAAKPAGESESSVETPKLFSEPSAKPATAPQPESASPPGDEEPRAGATEGASSRRSEGESTEETKSSSSADEASPSSAPAKPVTSPAEAPEQQDQEPSSAADSPVQSETEKEEKNASDGQGEADQPEGESSDEKPGATPESGPRYMPLDDALREKIRQELKRTRARELIDELVGELRYEVFEAYYDQYGLWEADRESAEEPTDGAKRPRRPLPQPPAPEPLEVLGQRIEGAGSPSELLRRSVEVARAHAQFGQVALDYGTTGPVNIYEISELEGIGEARECTRGEPARANAPPFANVAFQLPGLYASAEVCEKSEREDQEPIPLTPEPPEKSHTYLFWKVRDEPEFLPQQLSEVRDQVERAWRMDEARMLARKHAEELAEVAREKGTGLAESLAGERINPDSEATVTVLHPPAFTWLSRPEGRGFEPPGITDVEGIENVGEDFMRTVYRLAEGEVGVAPDGPEKTFYVVRADVMQPAPRSDLLREDLFGFMSEYQQLAAQRRRADQTSLVRRLIQEAGVEWEREDEGG